MRLTTRKIALAALVTTALGTAVAVAPSYAQTPPGGRTIIVNPRIAANHVQHPPLGAFAGIAGDLMAKFDTDGNGVVTQAEIDAVRAGELATYDANHDGVLNLEEYRAYWLAQMFERMVDAFQRLDANGDGNVTLAEFNEGLANIVARLDRDGDGALGPTDRPERPEGNGRGPGGPGGPDGPRGR